MVFLFSLAGHHLCHILVLAGSFYSVDYLRDLILVVGLVLLLKNKLWPALSVQDVVGEWVRADEGPVLNSGKAEACQGGEVAVEALVDDSLPEGDKEAKDWDWEEVNVLVPWEMRVIVVGSLVPWELHFWTEWSALVVVFVNLKKDDQEDRIRSRIEDEVGKCVLEGRVDSAAVGDVEE